jgi:hypothetical protein
MFYAITDTGYLLAVWGRSQYDEVMLHCARIGFNP